MLRKDFTSLRHGPAPQQATSGQSQRRRASKSCPPCIFHVTDLHQIALSTLCPPCVCPVSALSARRPRLHAIHASAALLSGLVSTLAAPPNLVCPPCVGHVSALRQPHATFCPPCEHSYMSALCPASVRFSAALWRFLARSMVCVALAASPPNRVRHTSAACARLVSGVCPLWPRLQPPCPPCVSAMRPLTLGGHEADTWRTQGGRRRTSSRTRPEHIVASLFLRDYISIDPNNFSICKGRNLRSPSDCQGN